MGLVSYGFVSLALELILILDYKPLKMTNKVESALVNANFPSNSSSIGSQRVLTPQIHNPNVWESYNSKEYIRSIYLGNLVLFLSMCVFISLVQIDWLIF